MTILLEMKMILINIWITFTYNSVKHFNIAPKDWKFSSFKKYVKQEFYQED